MNTVVDPVLRARDLTIRTRSVELLRGVDLTIGRGERVGLIGESGSGKSITSLAIMGLLPDNVQATGSVRLGERELLGTPERELARVRGRDVAMVFQEPMTALNPTMRIGDQVAEAMLIHHTQPSRAAAADRAIELLEAVRLPDPKALVRAYPHQLSGGQRQRVVLAIALANDPALLICDEPTTALDVTVQQLVLDLLVRGVEERDAAMLFITHDLAVVANVCEQVAVMYGGRIVEAGPVNEVFRRPRHRYTQGLLAASDLAVDPHSGQLRAIAGSVPAAGRFPEGCVFRSRCWKATDQCRAEPPWTGAPHGPGYACWHPAQSEVIT